MSPKEYFDMIRPCLRDMINDYKTRSEWKILLTMWINFISLKDSEETRTMYTKSRNKEIMIANKKDDITEEVHKSLLQNYKKNSKRTNERKPVCSW